MSTDPLESDNTCDANADALIRELQRAADRKYRLNRWTYPLSRISSICCLLYLFAHKLHMPDVYQMVFIVPMGLTAAAWIPEFVLLKSVYGSTARLKALIAELQRDVRAVGPLAQLCRRTEYFSVADSATDALLCLLPNLKAGDARYISDSQMQALLSLLFTSEQSASDIRRFLKLPLAILKALEQIGDSRAIPSVRRLASDKRDSWHWQEAQECLAVLEQQAETRDRQRDLLLPSFSESAQETLLRPTIPQAERQPELLLRAAEERERA